MVQNEDPTHRMLLAFNCAWQSALGSHCLLVYSTGRSPELYRKLWVRVALSQQRETLSLL
jgi:hypothetical protein